MNSLCGISFDSVISIENEKYEIIFNTKKHGLNRKKLRIRSNSFECGEGGRNHMVYEGWFDSFVLGRTLTKANV